MIESAPRGTAGAVRDALETLSERFLVLYGDTFLDVDLREMWNTHANSGASGTLLLHPNDHPEDSDLVEIDADGVIHSILAYPHPTGRDARNLVNAALYILESEGLPEVIPTEGSTDMAKQMFPAMLALGAHLHGYITPEYIKDMGTPARLDKVERDIIAGIPEKLSNRNLRQAVFLDRDGTLIREVNHLSSKDQIEILPEVTNAITSLNRNGILAVVVTNQPVVARGDITIEELNQIHTRLETLLGAEGAYLNGLYFCPHHPDRGFPGEVLALKGPCLCRKPQTGLIDQACRDLEIDRRQSWLVGDSTSDIEAGRRAGLRTILLRTGHAGADAKYPTRPDYICRDMQDAVHWISEGHVDLTRKMEPIAAAVGKGKRLVLIGGLARAGKSFAAQVLKELLYALGYPAHVISIDGWLKPKEQRSESVGVSNRYDITTLSNLLTIVMASKSREMLQEPVYDRISGNSGHISIEHSIGPNDIIIVEGVPALLMQPLIDLPNSLRVYVDISQDIRSERLLRDYEWRGQNIETIVATLAMRDLDETPIVVQSKSSADFVIVKMEER